MIIFIIVLILTIVFLILMCREDENYVFIAAAVVLSCLLIAISVVVIYENTFPRVKKMRWEERRNAIVYEMDHGFYVGDSLGDFNSELRAKQMIHKNPWVSWFSGKYIMEIKPIPTERKEE